jgi:hypothetical protein
MATAARELSLVTALRAAPAQFLLQEEQVDHGGANGGYGLAWGGSYRRRGRWPGELGFGKLGQRRKKPRLELVVGLLYGDELRLVMTPMKEGSPAREEKKSTAQCCRPCARRG